MRGEGRLLFPGRARGSPLLSDTAANGKRPRGPQPRRGSGLVKRGPHRSSSPGAYESEKEKKKRQQIYCVILNILGVFSLQYLINPQHCLNLENIEMTPDAGPLRYMQPVLILEPLLLPVGASRGHGARTALFPRLSRGCCVPRPTPSWGCPESNSLPRDCRAWGLFPGIHYSKSPDECLWTQIIFWLALLFFPLDCVPG